MLERKGNNANKVLIFDLKRAIFVAIWAV